MTDVLGPADAGAVNTLTTTTDVSNPTAGDTWFQDCVANNPATGTNLPSRFMNRLLQQVRRIIRLTGVPESNADDDMLGQAIQSGALNWAGTLGGTANALTATLSPAPTVLVAGLTVRGIASAANTGAATLNVNGAGGVAIVRASGAALTGAEIITGYEVSFVYNGTSWMLSSSLPATLPVSNIVQFSSSTPWTVPAGVYAIKDVRCWGGGGGGGGVGGISATAGAAGGSGGFAEQPNIAVTPGSTITVTVGAGGTAGASSGSTGGTGGTTSFGSACSASGGTGGAGATSGAGTPGGAGGSTFVGQFTVNGNTGGTPINLGSLNWVSGAGAGAPFVGSSSSGNQGGAGSAGTFPGGGGNGGSANGSSGFAGGHGGAGLCVIKY